MKHTYQITGMSCNGCRTKVEKTLNAIEGVEAAVSLEDASCNNHDGKACSHCYDARGIKSCRELCY
jgi:cation transport ATPase